MNIYYKNLNPNDTDGVTGSMARLVVKRNNYPDYSCIVDFGMVQNSKLKPEQLYKMNGRNIPLDGGTNTENVPISDIWITHSHADHIGLLGRVSSIEELDNVPIRMTELCTKISTIILEDACHLHNKECEKYNKNKKSKNKQMIPYMTPKSVEEVLGRIRSYSYDQEIIVAEGITVQFLSAGHLSGASSILFTIRDGEYEVERVLFSGDTSGIKPVPFTKPLNIKGLKINHIISEATYNDRRIEEDNFEEEFENYIKETCIEKRGKICCPVFSVGRSTNTLMKLRKVYEKNPQFKDIKIYFCSPLACKSHKILCDKSNLEFYDEQWHEEIDIINWGQVEYVENFKHLQKVLSTTEPCIYLASAGMVQAYSQYIIGRLISKKINRIVFLGYQAEGTKGRLLLDGIQKSMTIEDEDGTKKSVLIKSKISETKGQSGHSDYKDLCDLWSSVEKKKLKTILLNHGNPEGMEFFKNELEKVLPNVNVKITKYNELVRLV